MREILSFIFIIFISLSLSYGVSANPQEVIRSYLRQQCETQKQKDIARILEVDPSYLSKFISKDSPRNAPKIVENFQQKFPKIYQQLIAAYTTQDIYYSQSVNSRTAQHVSHREEGAAPVYNMPYYDFSSQVNLVVADPTLGPKSVMSANITCPYVTAGIQYFSSLDPLFLPYLKINQLYKRLETGQIFVENLGGLPSLFEIRLYGPDLQGRFGWVTREDTPLECFGVALKSEEIRSDLPVKYPVGCGYDGGHLLDCDHTPYPGMLFNSNKDPFNFTGANPTANRQIRRSLTQLMGNNAYREILLKNPASPNLNQRRKLEFHKQRNSWSTFEDGEKIPIPSGSIFIAFHPSRVSVYFLPENNSGNSPSLYESLYLQAQVRNPYATYRREVLPQFEVKNASQFFRPLVLDLSQPEEAQKVEFYRIFYNAVNLSPFMSLNNSLPLLKKMRLPFHWNGVRGLTQEQIQRLVSHIHRRNLQNEPNKLLPEERIDYSPWNNFRLPMLTSTPSASMTWVDASNDLIPTFSRLFSTADMKRFRAYVTGTLFAEAAKSPLASNREKLGIVSEFIREGDFETVAELLELTRHGVEKKGTLKESLWLLELYEDYFLRSTNPKQLNVPGYRSYLHSLIQKKSMSSTVEELLAIKQFNVKHHGTLFPLGERLATVKKITPSNSHLIKNGKLFPNKVWKLRNIFQEATRLEEVSLQGVIFSTTDFWATVAETEDNTIEDWVSSEEYFWEYERPLFRVLKALEKHSSSLRVLSLKNVAFGYFSEEENKLTYWLDAANVLRTLSVINLPNLEEIYLTGVLKPTDRSAINCLENLQNYFPKLRKLHLSLDIQKSPVELDPKDFKKVANIFRGTRKGDEDF